MGEESSDRAVDQAILAIKKGAHLLKCGRRGKPKFCPFRLSMDEKHLIWYSGQKEKQLRLSSVTDIVTGQRTGQSFSLVYANGERSLDLICKDKGQADSWLVGLNTIVSGYSQSSLFYSLSSRRGAQSCTNSPAGYTRRKYNLGLLEDATGYSQKVHSVCGSPSPSRSEWPSERFYTYGSGLSQMQHVMDILVPNSPCIDPKKHKKRGPSLGTSELQNNMHSQSLTPGFGSQRRQQNDVLKDIMIWGEGIAGILGGHDTKQADTSLPEVLESTVMLDVDSVSLGRTHAGLVTKHGGVFCWGEGERGRLGHKVNLGSSEPKIVDSLNGVHVNSIVCGEYQTCALTSSGELYTWGDNGYGARRNQWWPHRLSGPLHGVSISSVACGEWHTAIVSASGQLFTYGDGIFGVLGHGDLQSVSQPKEVESLKGLVVNSVACGPWHTAAIVEVKVDRRKGNLFTWGDGDKGRLGHDDTTKKLLPTCVAQLVDHDFVQVSCGRMLTVGLTSTGLVCTMGSAVHGQLGNPRAKDKSVTIVGGKLKEEFVKEISSGSYHVTALTWSGSVYTWGKGLNGQLGLGDFEDRNLPTLVEGLRDRQVESIACGSNITAAICLHKSVSVHDQSACKGCNLGFGLTRKKHNCYNCGLLFCGSCSSKKASNASLAPDKSKPSRVCDPCFNHLERLTCPWKISKLESQSPRLPLVRHKPSSDDCGEDSSKARHLSSTVQCWNAKSRSSVRKSSRNRGEKQQHKEPVSSLSVGAPRWGQVKCPKLFQTGLSNNNVAIVPFLNNQLSSDDRTRKQSGPSVSSTMNAESDNVLAAEIQRLRAEVRNLDRQCQIGSKRLQECRETIEEAWSVAKDEAAKCKEAKEIIKALALQLHTMSSKERLPRDEGDARMPQIKLIPPQNSTDEGSPRMPDAAGTPRPPGAILQKDRDMSAQDRCIARTDQCKQNGRMGSNHHEWVKQYEPGVYVTFMNLPSGQTGLKRVRFSRKRYSDREATRWWEENQAAVYQKYDIVGYSD